MYYSNCDPLQSIFQSIDPEPLKISDDLLLVDDVRKHGCFEILIANAIKKVLEVLPGDLKDLLERLEFCSTAVGRRESGKTAEAGGGGH